MPDITAKNLEDLGIDQVISEYHPYADTEKIVTKGRLKEGTIFYEVFVVAYVTRGGKLKPMPVSSRYNIKNASVAAEAFNKLEV